MTPPSTIFAASPGESSHAPIEAVTGEVPVWRSVVVIVLALLVGLFFWTKPQATLPPQAGVVMHLPGYVDSGKGYIGTTAEVTEIEHNILPPDTEFARKTYRDYPGHDDIFCGIVLSGATQQSIHRPEACLVGQGWTITDEENVPIQLPSGHILTVRNLTIKKAGTSAGKPVTITRYNMYWFVGEDVTTPYHFMRIFLSSWDRIVHNRAHRWAYVTVAAVITKDLDQNGLDAAQTKALMIDFIQHIVPTFQINEMTTTTTSN